MMPKNIKKNILIITVRADFGGGPEHIYNIIPFLQKQYNVFVAAPNDDPYMKRFTGQVGKQNIIEIPHRKFTFGKLLKLANFVKKNKIKAIHSHGKGAGIYSRPLAAITFCKCIHTFHGLHIGEYNSLQKKLYLWLERSLSCFTNRFICVSDGERVEVVKNGVCAENKVTVIDNGVRVSGITPVAGNIKTPVKVLHLSRFDEQKNSKLLVDVALMLREPGAIEDIRFVMLGDGEYKTDVEDNVRKNKLDGYFEFCGFRTNPGEYFSEADLYITTSLWEGMPLAVLEAMSYGLPVVATDVVGNNDIVKHEETGLLFTPDKPELAAEFIVKLLQDESLYKRLSENSRNAVEENYSVEAMGNKLVKLYAEVIG